MFILLKFLVYRLSSALKMFFKVLVINLLEIQSEWAREHNFLSSGSLSICSQWPGWSRLKQEQGTPSGSPESAGDPGIVCCLPGAATGTHIRSGDGTWSQIYRMQVSQSHHTPTFYVVYVFTELLVFIFLLLLISLNCYLSMLSYSLISFFSIRIGVPSRQCPSLMLQSMSVELHVSLWRCTHGVTASCAVLSHKMLQCEAHLSHLLNLMKIQFL